jgi:hypothetical protein
VWYLRSDVSLTSLRFSSDLRYDHIAIARSKNIGSTNFYSIILIPIIGAQKVTGRYRPLAKANQGISGQSAAVSCAKNPACEVENEVENPYNGKS